MTTTEYRSHPTFSPGAQPLHVLLELTSAHSQLADSTVDVDDVLFALYYETATVLETTPADPAQALHDRFTELVDVGRALPPKLVATTAAGLQLWQASAEPTPNVHRHESDTDVATIIADPIQTARARRRGLASESPAALLVYLDHAALYRVAIGAQAHDVAELATSGHPVRVYVVLGHVDQPPGERQLRGTALAYLIRAVRALHEGRAPNHRRITPSLASIALDIVRATQAEWNAAGAAAAMTTLQELIDP